MCRKLNPDTRLAQALLEDGSVVNADAYVEGSDGCIAALWYNPKARLSTEVPNRFLQDKQIMPYTTCASEPKAKAKAQPKLAAAAGALEAAAEALEAALPPAVPPPEPLPPAAPLPEPANKRKTRQAEGKGGGGRGGWCGAANS